jgi:hypothetical protein
LVLATDPVGSRWDFTVVVDKELKFFGLKTGYGLFDKLCSIGRIKERSAS